MRLPLVRLAMTPLDPYGPLMISTLFIDFLPVESQGFMR
jgi:hypothetical protein